MHATILHRAPLHLLASVSLVALTTTGTAAASTNVHFVGVGGGADFSQVQPAIDAAADGDVIIVNGGSYQPFVVDGKSLWITAEKGEVITVLGTPVVQNLPADGRVVLSGIQATGASPLLPGLRLQDNLGHVHAQDCSFTGAAGADNALTNGAVGVDVISSQHVVFQRCTIIGGQGATTCDIDFCTPGTGGSGFRTQMSNVALYECTVRGGAGRDMEFGGPAGNGGRGCRVLSGSIFASTASFTGGRGGSCKDFLPAEAGDGGDGLVVDSGAQARLLACTTTGGAAGTAFVGSSGSAGAATSGGGIITVLSGTPRKLDGELILAEGGATQVTIHGAPGDRVWFTTSTEPDFDFAPNQLGVQLLPPATRWTHTMNGIIPGSGVLQFDVSVPSLLTSSEVLGLFGQAKIIRALGGVVLSSPVRFLVANCNVIDPDCNGNGEWDTCDILRGVATDCDANDVPDSCDPDCNGNGTADACDIASGESSDVNENGVPDECDPLATWHVDASAAPGGNGSAAFPFRTIGEGLQMAASGDTVLVHDGVYVGAGNKNLAASRAVVALRSVNGPAACIIDCENSGYFLVMFGGGSVGSTISGFTVRNGDATAQLDAGAIILSNGRGTLEDCRFENCRGRVGAVRLDGAHTIRHCTFVGNQSLTGVGDGSRVGALRVRSFPWWVVGSPPIGAKVLDCTFVGNSTDGSGGALEAEVFQVSVPGGDMLISHCTFLDNSAADRGGAISTATSSPNGPKCFVENCLFAGNSAQIGGAIGGSGDSIVRECTITANSASVEGGAAYITGVWDNSQAEFENCVVFGNTAPSAPQFHVDDFSNRLTVRFCDVQGGQAAVVVVNNATLVWGSGNIDANPLFVDLDGADNNPATFDDNNYRLGALSPCTDAGDNGALPLDVVDLDGDLNTSETVPFDLDFLQRRVDDPAVTDTGSGTAPIVDLGCFERHP